MQRYGLIYIYKQFIIHLFELFQYLLFISKQNSKESKSALNIFTCACFCWKILKKVKYNLFRNTFFHELWVLWPMLIIYHTLSFHFIFYQFYNITYNIGISQFLRTSYNSYIIQIIPWLLYFGIFTQMTIWAHVVGLHQVFVYTTSNWILSAVLLCNVINVKKEKTVKISIIK